MKTSLLTILFLTLSMLSSFGQNTSNKVNILWGEKQKESKRSTLSDIIGHDETGIYAIQQKRKGLYGLYTETSLEHYNNKMNRTKSVRLDLRAQNKEKDFEFMVHQNDEIYVFSSFKNQKLKQKFLFIQSINKETLQANNDLKKITEVDYSKSSKYNSGNFNYETSRDSSKILIHYNSPYKKGQNEKFGFHIFDNTMNELWAKKVTLPYKEELFEIKDYKIDNQGNIHILGRIFKDKRREKRKGKPNYKYQILSYYNNGNTVKEYPIKIEGKFLTDMQIAIDDKQNLICAGFYSSENTYTIKGSYFLEVDRETKEIKTKNFNEFEIDFITQNMSKRKTKKTKKKASEGKNVELYKYNLDNIIIKDTGGAVLIGEQYFINTSTSMSDGKMYTNYHYHYNDIMVINISSEGKIEWAEKIPKKQVSINDGGFFSSYALSVIKDKLYFVFNDHPKNRSYTGQEKLYTYNKPSKSEVVLVTLNHKGEQTKETLFSVKEKNIISRPSVCEQISENEMILFGQKKKTQRLAKISFEK